MKIQTSKLVLIIDLLIAIILTGIVVHGAYLEKDMSHVVTVTGFWDAQTSVAIGFYFWKSKNENRSIHAMQLVRNLADKYGIEHVVNLANTILKD